MVGTVVHPLTDVLATGGLIPGEQKVMGSRPVSSSQIADEGVRFTREILMSTSVCLGRLVPLLHKYSLLWTEPSLLQRDVIVQVGELSPGKVSDKFEAFIWVTLGLDMSHQCLEGREQQTTGGGGEKSTISMNESENL